MSRRGIQFKMREELSRMLSVMVVRYHLDEPVIVVSPDIAEIVDANQIITDVCAAPIEVRADSPPSTAHIINRRDINAFWKDVYGEGRA